ERLAPSGQLVVPENVGQDRDEQPDPGEQEHEPEDRQDDVPERHGSAPSLTITVGPPALRSHSPDVSPARGDPQARVPTPPVPRLLHPRRRECGTCSVPGTRAATMGRVTKAKGWDDGGSADAYTGRRARVLRHAVELGTVG